MSRLHLVKGMCCALLLFAGAAEAVTFEVGLGKTYTTIQDAVDAAAALDVASGHNNPNPDPAEIVVYGGTYAENISIPADPAVAFNGLNDGWTIRNNSGDVVWLNGKISFGVDRDHFTVDGINVAMTPGSAGFSFAQTARNNTLQNLVIYGNQGNAGIGGANFYGTNSADHVTIYDTFVGVSVGYASSFNLSNSLVISSSNDGHYSSNGSTISYSNFYNNNPNFAGPGYTDGGGNMNVPFPGGAGVDPLFYSTDPSSPNFLWLQQNSPVAGMAASAGARTNGEFNMGALPTIPEPSSIILLMTAGLMIVRKRR